ncbi:MAG: hypothetical protein NXI10_07680 [bacterium]|nr:hypothetical protein [bacterium]
MRRYRKYYQLDSIALLVCILAALAAMIHSFSYFQPRKGLTEKEFIEKDYVKKNYKSVFEYQSNEVDNHVYSEAQVEQLERLIEVRKADYISNNENLNLLTQLLVAFLILGALILFYDPEEFQMPFIEVTIPATLFHLFIAFGMVYLWVQFGLSLNTGVDGRLSLNQLITEYELAKGVNINPSFSEIHTLIDKGIIDAWCHWYYHVFDMRSHGPFHDVISWIGLYVVYGGFWGAIHAVAIMLSTTIYEKKKDNTGGKLLLILFILTMLLLVAAGITFIVEFPHASRLISVSWIIATFILIYWIFWGREVARNRHVDD